MKLSERIIIDDERNEFTFDGFVFDGDFLARFFFEPWADGLWMRVHSADMETKRILLQNKFIEEAI